MYFSASQNVNLTNFSFYFDWGYIVKERKFEHIGSGYIIYPVLLHT